MEKKKNTHCSQRKEEEDEEETADLQDDGFHPLMNLLSNESTIALGQSSSSMEFEEYKLNEKVDLVTTTLGSKPPSLPLREERRSLGVETVFKAKGVGWQGVRKKYTHEKKEKEKKKKFLGCTYVISWDTCAGGSTLKACLEHDEKSTITCGSNLAFTTSHSNDEDYFKALTYEEYLEYLRRCQEKIKHGEKFVDYLELETSPDVNESAYLRRQRLFPSELEEQRDDGIQQTLSSQDLRELPSPVHFLSTTSYLSKDGQKISVDDNEDNNDYGSNKQSPFERKRVSFANYDEVRTIPPPKVDKKVNKRLTPQRLSVSQEDIMKEELMDDVNEIVARLGLEKSLKDELLQDVGAVMNQESIAANNTEESPKIALKNHEGEKSRKPTTPIANIDELSPRSKIQASRDNNLLDSVFTNDSPSPIQNINRSTEDANEIGMLKRALINVDSEPARDEYVAAPKSVKVSPLGKGAAADLARSLLNDIENIKDTFIQTKPTEKLQPIPYPKQAFYDESDDEEKIERDLMKVDSDLREDQAKRSMESISLAKMILDEVRSSLDEEEEALSRTSSVDSAELGPSVSLARSILNEVKKGDIPPAPMKKEKDEIHSSKTEEAKAVSDTVDIMKVDSDLREDQAKRTMESIGLAKMILDEVRSSLDEEEEVLSRASSVDSAEALARSILKEVKKGYIPPAPMKEEKDEIHSSEVEEVETVSDNVDIMKVDSDLREDREKRNDESIILSKLLLQEVNDKMDANIETTNSMDSSNSFNIPSQSVFRSLLNDENGICEASPRRSSSANLNHPAELAQRRAQDIRDRHQGVAENLTKSMSQESEDSWSQPHDTLKKKDILDDNESISMSIKVKKMTSAQQARRLLQQATIRHKKLASLTPRNNISQKAEKLNQKSSDKKPSPNETKSKNNAVDHVRDSTVKKAMKVEKRSTSSTNESKTSPKPTVQQINEENLENEKTTNRDQKESQSKLYPTPQKENELSASSSSFSDDSIDSMDQDSQCDYKHSADLARRLVENAKLRAKEVQKKPSPTENSTKIAKQESKEKVSLYKEFKGSSKLAQRLLLEAFSDSKDTNTRENIVLRQQNDSGDSSSKEEITREIMKQAGFSDLLNSFEEEGSFEKILKLQEDIGCSKEAKLLKKSIEQEQQSRSKVKKFHFESSCLESIQEENGLKKNTTKSSSQQSSQISTIALTSSEGSASASTNPPSSMALKSDSSTTMTASVQTETEYHVDSEKPNSVVSNLVSSTNASEVSFKTCIANLSTAPINENNQLHTLKTVKKSNLNTTKSKETKSSSETIIPVPTEQTITTTSSIDQRNEEQNDLQEFDEMRYTIPSSFSMVSCNSQSTNGFSIKSSKSFDNNSAEFEIEESISFAVNELNRINSMLDDAESSCHSSRASVEDNRDALFFAKQTKQEIAALAKTIENQMKAEQSTSLENVRAQVSHSYTEDSSCDSPRRIRRMNSPFKQDRMAKSPAMDRLIEDVNELCNQIENRIDNIVSDTQT